MSQIIGIPLAALLRWCYGFLGSYGWAIVAFTLLTKIILLPVTLWEIFSPARAAGAFAVLLAGAFGLFFGAMCAPVYVCEMPRFLAKYLKEQEWK